MHSNSEAELESLAEQWIVVKEAERAANAERLRIEDKLLALIPAKEEGSITQAISDRYKLKATGKLSYKADLDQLKALTADWPEDYRPIRIYEEADSAMLKAIRSDSPALWQRIASAVTVKPLKTSITIEDV